MDFSFTNTGAIAGGAPRFSIPVDTDGNGGVDGCLFISRVPASGSPPGAIKSLGSPAWDLEE